MEKLFSAKKMEGLRLGLGAYINPSGIGPTIKIYYKDFMAVSISCTVKNRTEGISLGSF